MMKENVLSRLCLILALVNFIFLDMDVEKIDVESAVGAFSFITNRNWWLSLWDQDSYGLNQSEMHVFDRYNYYRTQVNMILTFLSLVGMQLLDF